MRSLTKLFILGFIVGLIAAVPTKAHALALDLSLTTSPEDEINDAIFSRTDLSGQGSGSFKAFVRIQETGNGDGVEEGYNTDGGLEFDTKPGAFTHSILFSDIPLVDIDGTDYRQILLDAGENDTLTILALELYLLSEPDVSGYPANFPSGDLMYELAGDETYDSILLDNIIGNGTADLFAYIPDSNFTGENQYLYLYAKMGDVSGTFEEWGVLKCDPKKEDCDGGGGPTGVVPEPASILLLSSGLSALAFRRKNK